MLNTYGNKLGTLVGQYIGEMRFRVPLILDNFVNQSQKSNTQTYKSLGITKDENIAMVKEVRTLLIAESLDVNLFLLSTQHSALSTLL